MDTIVKLDNLNRVVVPKYFRDKEKLKEGAKVFFDFRKDSVIFSAKPISCFARNLDDLGRITIPKEAMSNLKIVRFGTLSYECGLFTLKTLEV